MKIGILLTSRNNYLLLKDWYNINNTENLEVLNIDEDSSEEQRELGKSICLELGITYMDREERGLQNNIMTACNYFEKKGCEWVIYFQHDCFTLEEDFFIRLENYLLDGKLNNFGVIGFNVLNGAEELRKYNGESTEIFTIGRSPLEPGDNWYRHRDRGHPDPWTPPTDNKTPFVVESVCWTSAMINIKQYKKYIIPTDEYQFFTAWDDIAFQFLYNNVYNVALPQFRLGHDQDIKQKYGIPKSSPSDVPEREYYFGKWGHLEVWKNRWGFEYGSPQSRIDFEKIKEHYKGTLLMDFYNHDPINGPMKFLDF